jgi:hypothetical protein
MRRLPSKWTRITFSASVLALDLLSVGCVCLPRRGVAPGWGSKVSRNRGQTRISPCSKMLSQILSLLISKMSYLLTLSSRLKKNPAPAPAPAPAPVEAVVELPVVELPAVEPEPIPESSEEQCALPPAPASTASSHTESSSE